MRVAMKRARPAVTGVILNPNQEVLLTLRSNKVLFPGQWCLPGGHLDGGTDWISSLKAEMAEEVGIEVKSQKLVGIYSDPELNLFEEKGEEFFFVVASFLIDGFGGVPTTSPEVDEVGWFSLETLPKNLLKCERVKIQDALSFTGQAVTR